MILAMSVDFVPYFHFRPTNAISGIRALPPGPWHIWQFTRYRFAVSEDCGPALGLEAQAELRDAQAELRDAKAERRTSLSPRSVRSSAAPSVRSSAWVSRPRSTVNMTAMAKMKSFVRRSMPYFPMLGRAAIAPA